MHGNLTKSGSIILILILLFTNVALGMNKLESPINLGKFKQQKMVSLKGVIVGTESGMPLTSGNVRVSGHQVTVKNGEFQLENLSPGLHKIEIEAPFRKKYETDLLLKAGVNQVNFSIDTILTEDEIHMLAKITRAEAEGETELGQTAVAATVLNRVLSNKYPNTVQEVVYQKVNGRYQYSPVFDGRINVTPRKQDYKAAYLALAGNDPTNGATGFYNPAKTRDQWVHSHPVTTQIGGHRFFIY